MDDFDADVSWSTGIAYVFDEEGVLGRLDLTGGDFQALGDCPDLLMSVRVSPDGQRLLVDDQERVFVLDAQSCRQLVVADAGIVAATTQDITKVIVLGDGVLSVHHVSGRTERWTLPEGSSRAEPRRRDRAEPRRSGRGLGRVPGRPRILRRPHPLPRRFGRAS